MNLKNYSYSLLLILTLSCKNDNTETKKQIINPKQVETKKSIKYDVKVKKSSLDTIYDLHSSEVYILDKSKLTKEEIEFFYGKDCGSLNGGLQKY